MTVEIPEEFTRLVAGRAPRPDVSGDDWLRSLPGLVRACEQRWDLSRDGRPRFGRHALSLPVVDADGTAAVLVLRWPHREAAHDHLALRAWDGAGAAHLIAADPSRFALVLERLDADRDLQAADDDEASATLGALLRRLDRPALPRLDRLSGWAQRLRAVLTSPAASRIPRRFAQQARSSLEDLLAHDVDARLVHTDLHGGNVLSGDRGWTAISPSPVAGEPAFAVWPTLHRGRRDADLSAWTVHSRLGGVCDAAGIDEDRARAWAFARTVAAAIATTPDDRAALTRWIALAKVLQQRW